MLKNKLKPSFLITLIFLLPLSPPAYALEWSGYYEGQVTGNDFPGSHSMQMSSRLRIDLAAKLGPNASITADAVAMVYTGLTKISLLDVLPGKIARELEILLSPGAGEAFSFHFEDSLAVDNAFISLYPGPFTIRLGRQQLPWGTGYAWNPTDVFNTKSLLEPAYEKPGVDALKAEWGFGKAGGLTIVLIPGMSWYDSTRAGRGKINLGVFDISTFVIHQVCETIDPLAGTLTRESSLVLGGDFAGQVLEWGVWAEAAWFQGPQEKETWQVAAGIDTTFEFQTSFMLEYFRDSDGKAQSRDYTLSDWLQLAYGGRKTLGRDYGMIMVSHPLSALLTSALMTVFNLNDGSAMLAPSLTYNFSDNLDITLCGNIFIGPNEESEYGGLHGNGGYLRIKGYF